MVYIYRATHMVYRATHKVYRPTNMVYRPTHRIYRTILEWCTCVLCRDDNSHGQPTVKEMLN